MPLDIDKIRILRLGKRLSQTKAAELADIGISTYAKIERGENLNPEIATVKAIADVIGAKVSDIWIDG